MISVATVTFGVAPSFHRSLFCEQAYREAVVDFAAASAEYLEGMQRRIVLLRTLMAESPDFSSRCTLIAATACSQYDQRRALAGLAQRGGGLAGLSQEASLHDRFSLGQMFGAHTSQFYIRQRMSFEEFLQLIPNVEDSASVRDDCEVVVVKIRKLEALANDRAPASGGTGGVGAVGGRRSQLRSLGRSLISSITQNDADRLQSHSGAPFVGESRPVEGLTPGAPAMEALDATNSVVPDNGPVAAAEPTQRAGGLAFQRLLRVRDFRYDVATGHFRWSVEGGADAVRLLETCGRRFGDVKFTVRGLQRDHPAPVTAGSVASGVLSTLAKVAVAVGTTGGIGLAVLGGMALNNLRSWGISDLEITRTFAQCRSTMGHAVSPSDENLPNDCVCLECAMPLSTPVGANCPGADFVAELVLTVGGGGRATRQELLRSAKIPFSSDDWSVVYLHSHRLGCLPALLCAWCVCVTPQLATTDRNVLYVLGCAALGTCLLFK